MSIEQKDLIWEQHFLIFRKAFNQLTIAINIFKPEEDEENFELEEVDELLKEGLIHRFEYTFGLACSSMKAYAEFLGHKSSSDLAHVIRDANRIGLIEDVESWLEMIKTIGDAPSTYSKITTDEIFEKLIDSFYTLLFTFETKMKSLRTYK
jgi:nucleotidyltransferase substrate binding protein (TIGR01987 family)